MSTTFIIASVAGQRVALEALAVEGIIRIGEIIAVPRAPAHVAGLCAMRSTVMTVIDVASTVGRKRKPGCDHAAVVLHAGHRYALLVDHIADVQAIDMIPTENDANIGAGWLAVAPLRVEATDGAALLLDVESLVNGPSH